MTVPEVIAKLDALEQQVDAVKARLREIRYELFETLDGPDDELVD